VTPKAATENSGPELYHPPLIYHIDRSRVVAIARVSFDMTVLLFEDWKEFEMEGLKIKDSKSAEDMD
jgi:hypothetical protein